MSDSDRSNANSSSSVPQPMYTSVSSFPKHQQFSASNRIDIENNIQESINSAAEASEVYLKPGDFTENLNISKNVILTGNNSTIKSDGTSNTLQVKTANASISGFTFIQNDSQSFGALLVEDGDIYFENCKFISKLIPSVIVKGKSTVFFVNCEFRCSDSTAVALVNSAFCSFVGCSFDSSIRGLNLRSATTAFVSRSTFLGMTTHGVSATQKSQYVIEESSFSSCRAAAIESKTDGKLLQVDACRIENCDSGILVFNGSVTVSNSKIGSMSNYSLLVQGSAQVTTNGNEFNDNSGEGAVIACEGGRLIANKDKFTGIMKCGIAAFSKSSIKVSDATFDDITGHAVVLFETTSGTIQGSRFYSVKNHALVFSGDQLMCNDAEFNNISGNGIYINGNGRFSGSKLNISNCFDNNLFVDRNNTKVMIDNSTFSNEKTAILVMRGNILVSNCSITSKIGIDARESNVTFEKSKVQDNETALILQSTKCEVNNVEFNNTKETSVVTNGGSVNIWNAKFNNGKHDLLLMKSDSDIRNTQFEGAFAESIVLMSAKVNMNSLTFNNCNTAIFADDRANISCTNTKITGGDVQIDIQNKSSFIGNNCELVGASGSAAVFVHEEGSFTLSKSSVKDARSTGIIASANSDLKELTVTNCEECGIYILGTGKVSLKDSTVSENGKFGLFIETGTLESVKNKFVGQKEIGIKIGTDAVADLKENTFENNGITNIERK
ncbi:hypothetical protein TVAG_192540 [Trichomonas vaginalis G3]|uniref:Right handed beta helix domain-containing protein n=1 Tax=Trichomonas vaginalis (strain ATCC PRA-98 / G3) TaxID=412133 RepID=A2DGW8_TRIV3|nr:pectin lyase-like family [Trichomonas vaginalis G3]EAY20278.1 hypothetical protein TVAG_192540 [Trichomonas vaginalis G3]KAI5529150.1 pectin lyase-like family [Trichomonas vaginalis G3]|eukprot:XP_001581264.1 hypothetical protein [Trichomonas vaginalis G3]